MLAAQPLHLGERFVEATREAFSGRASLRLALTELEQLTLALLSQQGIALDVEPIALGAQATQLILELLDTSALDLHRLID